MSIHLDDLDELQTDRQLLEDALANANENLQAALRELDNLLKESAATLWGYARGPNHKERVRANSIALDAAHDEIESANKALFRFKLKHGEDLNSLAHGAR
jgi:hypothetical protein